MKTLPIPEDAAQPLVPTPRAPRPSSRAGRSGDRGCARRGPAARAPLLVTVLGGLVLAGGARAQTAEITSLSVSSGTTGTVIEIAGSGFGEKAPAVSLAQAGGKAKGTKLKVLGPAADDLVSVEVTAAFAGVFTILLDPKGKDAEAVESEDTFEVVPPTIEELDDNTFGLPNGEVTAFVRDAGSKGRRVEVAGRKAKIVSVEPAGTDDDGDQGELSQVVFRIPKKVPNGTWEVAYENTIGVDVAKGGLTVVGSTAKLGKPRVKASIEGAKAFNAKAKKIDVATSFGGPTTVTASTGGSNARTLTIVLPFVLGSTPAPQFSSAAPASIHYEELKQGTTALELMSVDDQFTVLVSAAMDGRVAGSFCGTLFPVVGDGGPREIRGTFVYDGTFELDPGSGDTSTELPQGTPAPGLAVQILGVSGAKGPTGNFQPGDKVRVTFRLAKDDGSAWLLDELSAARAAVSGPTSNYQRVIAQTGDVRDTAVDNGDGTYTYTFPTPLPDQYLPSLNDTDAFGAADGELAGQPLLDGTYTVGLWCEWDYTSSAEAFREVGTGTRDFLLGASVEFPIPRQVVTTANCNQCHVEVQFHGGTRRTNELCVLCHTAGAEDRNDPDVAGGTPGVTIEWGVMVHKLHSGRHLPSVLGVTTDANGDRDYTADPVPYQLVGFGNAIADYSSVAFPAWPNVASPMPRDAGFADLEPELQAVEDQMRSGPTGCDLCHGDPDGAGPLLAPSQGVLAYTQPRRATCGSCHDDWVFDRPYTANMQTMGPQLNDATCILCHAESGDAIAVRDGHRHPLQDPAFAAGVDFDLLAVEEAGTSDGDGTVDPGEGVTLTFTLRDDAGVDIDPADLASTELVMGGPSENMQILLGQQSLPAEMLTGAQPYTINVPMRVYLEAVGDATDGDDEFTTAHVPHWDATGHLTEVRERTGFGAGDSTLVFAVFPPVNFVDVDDATGFARDDFVVIDDGTPDAEYLQIQVVDGNRLWFSSPQTPAYAPGPTLDHAILAPVREVTLDLATEGDEYVLDAASGTITELSGFGTGNAIVVTYSTDFVMPDTYPLALNDGPDLTEVDGGWTGKTIVDGTYSLALWGSRPLTLELFGETNDYVDAAPGVRRDFLVGDATLLEPYDLIESAASCYACHVDLQFHDDVRRGWESCLGCHGTAAAGDRPIYVAPNAPPTDGVTVNFREMLHKIHRGKDLANASTYTVVGSGIGFPDNYTATTYETVVYPAMPSATQDCVTCHGPDNTAWLEPGPRDHPTEQGSPAHSWSRVCASCHDASSVQAHIESNTSPIDGTEACTTCHAPGKVWPVDAVHLVR